MKKLTNEKVSIVLITEEVDRAEILTVEASKSVVIDTAWIKTAVEEKWFEALNTKDTLKEIDTFPFHKLIQIWRWQKSNSH